MIEVQTTVTITNDGSVWTMTPTEARALRDQLNSFLGDTFTSHPPTFFQRNGHDQSVSTGSERLQSQ